MKTFFKSLSLFTIFFFAYYGTSVYFLKKQSETFHSDIVSSINENNAELLKQYKPSEFNIEELKELSEKDFDKFKDLHYDYETLVDSVDKIKNVKVNEIYSNIDLNLIYYVKIDCYNLIFNNNPYRVMRICTQQTIGNTEIVYIR